MKAFLAIKYYEDMRNKNLIETICKSFENQNIQVFAFARNIQNYGPCNMPGDKVMNLAFAEIKKSDIFIIDASELSIGIGIEAGVAFSNNIPATLCNLSTFSDKICLALLYPLSTIFFVSASIIAAVSSEYSLV